MPSQCLLVGMQVPLGHWKPLHFFSDKKKSELGGFRWFPFRYKKTAAQPRFPFSLRLPSFGGIGVISLGLQKCPRAIPQSAGSSSEPSWQSASPSHAQRCGMQWPLRHWKLEASHVWDTAGSRAGSGAEHGALSTTQPCALPLHRHITSRWVPARIHISAAQVHTQRASGSTLLGIWVSPGHAMSFSFSAVFAHKTTVPLGWFSEAPEGS